MIHVYTGNGKGKTTSALGLILRSLGHNHKVCLIQFMKGDWKYGEINMLKSLPNIDIYKFGTLELVDPNSPDEIDFQEAEAGYRKAKDVLFSHKYHLVILDEINVAVYMKLLPLNKQLELCQLAKSTELVMTGRYAHQSVIDQADLVTEMKLIKHYFDQGITSREGIEF